ncbi:MAG: JmjC domain-containing histone demethylation protein 1 [Vezdaea aestivalis]|nr:MAG: JmjC domain-containing histone demethylation protein 1 [Vezdaea aestivalis]
MIQSRSFRQFSAGRTLDYRTPSPPPPEHVEPLSPFEAYSYPTLPNRNPTPRPLLNTSYPQSNFTDNLIPQLLENAPPEGSQARQSSALDALATLATSPTFNNGTFASPRLADSTAISWQQPYPSGPVAAFEKRSHSAEDSGDRPAKRARSEAPIRVVEDVKSEDTRPATSYIEQKTWATGLGIDVGNNCAGSGKEKAVGMEDIDLLLNFSRGKIVDGSTARIHSEIAIDGEPRPMGPRLLDTDEARQPSDSHEAFTPAVEDDSEAVQDIESLEAQTKQSTPASEPTDKTKRPNGRKKDSKASRGWPKGVSRNSRASGPANPRAKQAAKPDSLRILSEGAFGPPLEARPAPSKTKSTRKAKTVVEPPSSRQLRARPSLSFARTDITQLNQGHNIGAFHTRLSNFDLMMSKNDFSVLPRGRAAPAPLDVNIKLETDNNDQLLLKSPSEALGAITDAKVAQDIIDTIDDGTVPKRQARSGTAPIVFSDEVLTLNPDPTESSVPMVATSMQRSASSPGEGRPSSRGFGVYQGIASEQDVEGVNFTRCAGCSLVQNALGEGEEAETLSWIGCDGCKRWFHTACAGLRESQIRTVDRFSCRECHKKFGPTTFVRKSARAHTSIDYAGLNEGLIKTSAENPDHPYIKPLKERTLTFLPDDLTRVHPSEVSYEYLQQPGNFTRPLLIPGEWNERPESSPSALDAIAAVEANPEESLAWPESISKIKEWFATGLFFIDVADRGKDGLGMIIPRDLSVRHVATLYGPDEKVEVIDVKTQGEAGPFTMRKWADYYESKTRKLIRNVISLEISCSFLGRLIRRPDCVREMDLADSVWPRELRAKGDWPKVQSYCLMSVADSFTDFHIDFGGSSVFYHILKGKKTFLFISPKQKHLKKYEQWCLSPAQNQTFLPDQTKECMRVDLSEGDTMLIPSGWIHAVWTPEDSLVIGGNFLTRLHYSTQIQITEIEKATRVPAKFRHPHFQRIMWFTAIKYMKEDPTPQFITDQLHGGQQIVRPKGEEGQAVTTVAADLSKTPEEQSSAQDIITSPPPDLDASAQLLQESLRAQGTRPSSEPYYPRMELDGLVDLCRFLLRTALIVTGAITDGISNDTRARVGRAIPKGNGDPVELMKRFAVWIAWKRGNENIPEWAYPEYSFENGNTGTTQKLNNAALKRLERDATQAAKRRNPVRGTASVDAMGVRRKVCDDCRKKRVRCPHIPEPSQMQAVGEASGIAVQPQVVAPAILPFPSTEAPQSIASEVFPILNPPSTPAPAPSTPTVASNTPGSELSSKLTKSRACEDCRKSKRRCIHDLYGGIDELKAQAAIEQKTTGKKRAADKSASSTSGGKAKKVKVDPANGSSIGASLGSWHKRTESNASTVVLDEQIALPPVRYSDYVVPVAHMGGGPIFDEPVVETQAEPLGPGQDGAIFGSAILNTSGSRADDDNKMFHNGAVGVHEVPVDPALTDSIMIDTAQAVIEEQPAPAIQSQITREVHIKPEGSTLDSVLTTDIPPIDQPSAPDLSPLSPSAPEEDVSLVPTFPLLDPIPSSHHPSETFTIAIPPPNPSFPPTPHPTSTTLPLVTESSTQPTEKQPHHPSSPLSPPTTHSDHAPSILSSARSTTSPSEPISMRRLSSTIARTPAATPNGGVSRRSSRTPKVMVQSLAVEQAEETRVRGAKFGRKAKQSESETQKAVERGEETAGQISKKKRTASMSGSTVKPGVKRKSITPAGDTAAPLTKKRVSLGSRVGAHSEEKGEDDKSVKLAKELSGVEFGLRRRGGGIT